MSESTERSVSEGAYPQTLQELAEQFCWHAVHVRGVLDETAEARQLYLWRFFDWFGPHESPTRLFAAITPDSITKCLASYCPSWSPSGSGSMMV